MKTPSTDLFNLIKSLQTQEKVFFKVNAAKNSLDKNAKSYLILFDAINKLKHYDEKILQAKLKKAGFTHHFKKAKSYLTEAILKCLQEYHSFDTADALLGNRILQIQILINKQLFDLAKRMIIKAEKAAIENHSYYYLSIILSLKREVMVLKVSLMEMNNYPHSHYLNEIKCIETLKNIIDYGKPYVQTISAMNSQVLTTDKKRTELKTLIKNPLLKDETKALSLPAKLMYYTILGNMFYLLNDWKKNYLNRKNAVRLLEQNPAYLKNKIASYMGNINNLFLAMIRLKKDEELLFLYHKVTHFIESLPKKIQSNVVYRWYIAINNNYIAYKMESLDIAEALNLSEKLKASINKYSDKQHFLVFHSNLFVICFYLEDYHKALQQVNEILNTREEKVRQDIFNEAKILNIIVHYELGNEDILPGLCKSVFRYFEKKGQLQQAERLILNFFSKDILKANTKQKKKNIFIELKKRLLLAMSEKTFYDFDFISWIESKIENRPFAEIVRSRHRTDSAF